MERNLSEADILSMNIPFIGPESGNIVSISGPKKHILSHQIIRARLIHAEISENAAIPKSFVKVKQKDISKFAIPRLLELFIEALDF
jgi:A/G-specific adenine glycosylase